MISLRDRLALTLALGAGVILVLAGVVMDRMLRVELVRRQDAALLARAWALANALRADDGAIELESTYGFDAALAGGEEPVLFQVWHQDGRVAGRSARMGDSALPQLEARLDAPVSADADLPGGIRGRAVGVRMQLVAEEAGEAERTLDHMDAEPALVRPVEELTIVLAQSLRDVESTMSEFRRGAFVVGAVTLIMGGLLLAWALRRGLAPLQRLAERAALLDTDSIGAGLGTDALPVELEPIRNRFNELLARLHDGFERERRFNSAVSHELRTPIAELRTLVEVELLDRDSVAREAPLRMVLSVTRRMQALVEALMLLRRVETGESELPRTTCDVSQIVDEMVEANRSTIAARGLTVDVHCTRPVIGETHRELFACAVRNLIANAVDHAPARSRVEIRLAAEAGRIRFEVANPAPDLEPGDVEHLLEPFWRKDRSRTDSVHAGLGLSITHAIARALEFEFSASLSREGDLRCALVAHGSRSRHA